MALARAGKVIFGFGALAVGMVSLVDIVLHGRLTLFPPLLLVALAVVGVGLLFVGLLDARGRARMLQATTGELRSLASKLEASLATVSAVNARLHESEVRYKGLVDSQGDAIVRRAPDSRLTYANDAFFKLFGLSPQQTIGHAFAPELHPDSRAPHFGSFAGLETGRARVRYDQHVRTAYGWRWIAWEDYAVRDANGQLIEIQSVGRDITERKALEDALTEARDKAEAASRAKSGFLATMSHEIRTPMNGVLGMARLLLETPMQPEQKSYAEAIRQSGESLLKLIEDILDFSKIESGTMTLEDDEVEPQALVAGVVELLAPRAHAKGIEVVAVLSPQMPQAIRTDGDRMRQILTNLVGNAVKFTERGGVRIDANLIEVRGRKFMRFEVRDTGVGVPPEKRDDIFNEFVQADSTHARRFGGSGLGLAICKRLVDAMDGDIGVDPAPGGGSLFWFMVPVIAIREAKPQNATCLAGFKVSIVARNSVLREGLTAQIRAGGGEVVSLKTADEIATPNVDAILIDAGTGDQPELPAWPDARVRSIVLLTPGARGKLSGLKTMGFAGYLVKPVRQSSLAEQLRDKASVSMSVRKSPVEPHRQSSEVALHVLLAEDNPINAMLIRELLRRRGHRVSEVTTGLDAVSAMIAGKFDLVLTDIHMPGLDGVEATRRIREDEARNGRARTPIVALTADALETGKRACQDAGMDGFLTKPVDPAELDMILGNFFPASGARIAAA
ncbi:MAG TPA: ATP-binding protein [Rhizomicrobium sp.]|nr:ATP-binding protein [Rhizomicrobium sp.]